MTDHEVELATYPITDRAYISCSLVNQSKQRDVCKFYIPAIFTADFNVRHVSIFSKGLYSGKDPPSKRTEYNNLSIRILFQSPINFLTTKRGQPDIVTGPSIQRSYTRNMHTVELGSKDINLSYINTCATCTQKGNLLHCIQWNL